MSSLPLKTGARRSVRVEDPGADTARVVKRILVRGLAGPRTARLARSEHEVQCALFARGLAVPEPLELRPLAEGVELVSRHLEGARPLSELARRPGALRVAPELVARRVGALLAQAHGLGLDHPDLHEHNLLVTPDGRPFLIDFHGASLRSRLGARVAWRDLVQLAGATRERVPRALRQRALAAWWRSVAPALRPAGTLAALAAGIEDAARLRRRAALERGAKRWLRPSSLVRALEPALLEGTAQGLARVELDGPELRMLCARARAPAAPGEPVELGPASTLREDLGPRVRLELHSVRRGALLRAWSTLGRLEEHAVRAARPLVLLRRPLLAAVVALPAEARPFAGAWLRAQGEARTRLARALGTLLGTLEDRRLGLRGPSLDRLWIDGDARAWFGPGVDLTRRPASRSGEPWNAGLALLGDAAPREQRAYLAAWRAAERGGSADG